LAFFHQPVEMQADMRRFGGRMGERNRLVERDLASAARPSCINSPPFTPKKWK
jgi:hypothetical protein